MIRRLLQKGLRGKGNLLSFKRLALGIVASCAIIGNVHGQSMANYAFTSSATGSLVDMSSGTTSLLSGSINASASSVTAIGFNFYFMGVKYTQFSVNADGQIRLGGTAISTAGITAYAASTAIIAPMGGNNRVYNGVSYKVIGTPGSRTLVISWNQFTISDVTGFTNAGNMQAWLDETTGKITFMYGAIYNSSNATQSRPYFLSSGNTAGASGYVTVGTTPTFESVATAPVANGNFSINTAPTGTTLAENLGSVADGSRITFAFTPVAPSASPSGLTAIATGISTMTLNWADNATNELGYSIEYSTDNVNWTATATNAPANATTYNLTGLLPNTNYFLRVAAFTEGAVSTPVLTNAQTNNCTGITGTVSIGATGAAYTTITAALSALNTTGFSGTVALELQSNYTAASETYPVVLSNLLCGSSSNTVTIRPAANVATPITLTSGAASSQTINIDGGSYYTIDGRPGGIGTTSMLTIDNTVATGSSVRFINAANNNTVKYCKITGVSTGTIGVIAFSTTTGGNTTGSSFNAISNCDITQGSTVPLTLLSATGTASTPHAYNNISNNNFSNFGGGTAYGINIAAASKWLIDGNSFYQTNTTASGNVITAINISNTSTGDSFTVRNNYIGGSGPLATGTWNSSVATSTNASRIAGISIGIASANSSNIDNNTIANFMLTTTAAPTTAGAGIFYGILISGGSVNVGVNAGNIIGSLTNNSSIRVSNTATLGSTEDNGVNGIFNSSTGNITIKNNKIAGLDFSSTGTSIVSKIRGIVLSATGGVKTVSNNSIGSELANSLQVGSATSTVGNEMIGISSAATGTVRITQNTVRNLIAINSVNVSCKSYGIYFTAGTDTVTNNIVHDITNASNNGGVGIYAGLTAGTGYVGNNNIYSIVQKGATSGSATGIYSNAVTGTTVTIAYNTIQDIKQDASIAAGAEIWGMSMITAGTFKVYNNTINLDNAGSPITNASKVIGIKLPTINGTLNNNIVKVNALVAASTVGRSTCLWNSVAPTATTFNANNNLYYINNADSNYIYLEGSTYAAPTQAFHNNLNGTQFGTSIVYDANFNTGCSLYKTYINGLASGKENASFTENTPLTGGSTIPDNLKPNPAGISYAQNGGLPLGFTVDALNAPVSTTPDMGAIEFSTGTAVDAIAPNISYTASTLLPNTANICVGPTVSIAITDAGAGVNTTAGTAPRIWYKKGGLTTGNQNTLPTTNDNTTDGWKWVSTNSTSSPYSFTIDYSKISGGITNGDSIYYFVVAQDNSDNVSNAAAFYAQGYCPSSVALAAGAFPLFSVTNKYALLAQPATVVATSTGSSACLSGTTTLSTTSLVAGDNIKWQSSTSGANTWGDIAGATSASYATGALTSDTDFRCVITNCANNVVGTSNTLTYSVSNPQITSTTPAAVCAGSTGTLQVTANAGSSVKWYANLTGGTVLATGNSFVTPTLNATTSYYAEAAKLSSAGSAGRSTPATFGTTSITGTTAGGYKFNALKDVIIDSVSVWATADTGTITIQLQNSSGTVLQTATVYRNGMGGSSTTPAKAYLPLNFSVPAGPTTDYRLVATVPTTISLVREQGTVSSPLPYPYSIPNVYSITSNMINGAPNFHQCYFIYDTYVSTGCVNPTRQAVTATVTPNPLTALPDTTGTCNGVAAALNSNASTTTWSPLAGLYTNAAGTTPYTGAALQTVYGKELTPQTVYATTTSGACTFNDSVFVDVQAGTLVDVTPDNPIMACGAATAVSLTSNTPVSWTVNGGNLYTDASATSAYTAGASTTGVFAKAVNNRYVKGAYNVGGCIFADSALVVVNNATTNAISNNTGATNTDSTVINGATADLHNTDCELMASVTPAGSAPVNGWITGKVIMDGTVQNTATGPYVTRHFELTPKANTSTSGANITLYFTQAEFDAYNTYVTNSGNSAVNPLLPANPAGSTANILVDKFNAATGSPSPTNNNSAIAITPTSVTWDATNSWWAVTFPTTGFSGFFLHTNVTATPLPIDFVSFKATAQQQSNQLTWTMGNAAAKGSFEVMHSLDGARFESIGTVTSNDRNEYAFNHETPKVMEVYQIKFNDVSGKAYYSQTQIVQRKDKKNLAMMLYPNPMSQNMLLKVNVMNASDANVAYSITNILGEEVLKGTIETMGNNDVTAQINIGSLANGIYNFKLVAGNDQIVRKLVVAEK